MKTKPKEQKKTAEFSLAHQQIQAPPPNSTNLNQELSVPRQKRINSRHGRSRSGGKKPSLYHFSDKTELVYAFSILLMLTCTIPVLRTQLHNTTHTASMLKR